MKSEPHGEIAEERPEGRAEPARGAAASDSQQATPAAKPKMLVAIANHGTKNRHFLDRLLREYRSMKRYDIDVVVLSNIPKDLGPDVEVRVGAPIKDPWSLPFGHKQLFHDRLEDYDLFIYSEDDTLISEGNVDAFVEETVTLPDDVVAGFMRYEVSPEGRKFYSSMHSHYHWDPKSVVRIGNSLYAYYTNEHAACFILTREQLRRAIDSGGFMLPARKGRYDMLVTAATDPYTQCGMRKMICISRFDEFCLHHLPNVYCGKLGLDADLGRLEIERLASYAEEGAQPPVGPLFDPHPLRDGDRWNKGFYEHRREDVLDAIPSGTRTVLSVGCGCGTTEAEMVRRGAKVTAIPLDSVIMTSGEVKGLEMLPPDFELAARELEGRRFDCILFLDILQQLRDPVEILAKFRPFVDDGGVAIVSVPNWNYHGTLRQRLSTEGRKSLECRASAGKEGVHRTSKSRVKGWLRKSGFRRLRSHGSAGARLDKINRRTLGLAEDFLCRRLLLVARR